MRVAVTCYCHKLDLVAHKFLISQKNHRKGAFPRALLPLLFPKGDIPALGSPAFLVEQSVGNCNKLWYFLIRWEI